MTGVQTLAEGFESYREWIQDPIPRIGFGMKWFDEPTGGGLARSEICMLQAFSSVGKTTVALNIIRNNPHVPALLFSLEMNWRMVAARIAAMEMATSTKDLEARFARGEDVPQLQQVADRFRGFTCDDTPGIKLRQAIRNLVSNAVEAQPSGGTIQIEATCAPREIRVCVRDAGPGIPIELHSRVTDPFFTTRAGGTGLGLALVHSIAQLHGGALEIGREPSALGGAEILLRIPTQSAPTQ